MNKNDERFKRLKRIEEATPVSEKPPLTIGDAIYALNVVASDPDSSPALAKEARRERRRIVSHYRRHAAAVAAVKRQMEAAQ